MSDPMGPDRGPRAPGADPAPTSTPTPTPAQGQPQLPLRRSVRERLAQAPGPGVVGPRNPLTETTTTAIGGLDMLDTAFRVAQTGEVVLDDAAPIAAPLQRLDDAAVIDRSWALEHHLLLLSEEVEPDELEALAISVWEGAGWAGPGMLRLGGGAALQGPWRIDTAARAALGTAADLHQAWVLLCPPQRGTAPKPELLAVDEWAEAFPQGMPVGIEFKVLLTLRRMARRLAGSVRVSGSGHVFAPDPDSAVNLSIYSPRWLNPEQLLDLLRPDFPEAIDSRDVPLDPDAERRLSPREVERVAAVSRTVEPLPEEIVRAIDEARRKAAESPQVVDGYAVVAPAGNRSEFMLEVHRVPRPPQALRWESWTKGVIVEYTLRWMPAGGMETPVTGLTRTARLERLRSTASIETAAALVVAAVGGAVIDEDGFLVALDA